MKDLIIDYADKFFPECSFEFFNELQNMILMEGHPQRKAFLEWVDKI